MAKKLHLTIPEPCHENWDSMTPAEKGKFCGTCSKQVIDFSNMSDRQVAEFFKKPSKGSVCGRFMTDQLNRDLEIPKKRLPWIKYFFNFLIPALFLSKAGAQDRLVGKISISSRDTTRIPIDREIKTLGMVVPDIMVPVCKDTAVRPVNTVMNKVKQVKVNGRIIDESGNAIPNASITIVENGKIFRAEDDGRFTFITRSDKLIELVCSSVGFAPASYAYPFTLQYSQEVDITIQLKKQVVTMPEVVVNTICEYKRIGYITGIVTVKGDSIKIVDTVKKMIEPLKEPTVRFYPNPIKSGQTLHIGITGLEEGYYTWQMFDIHGKLVQNTEMWIDSEARLLEFQIPFVSSGTYIAVLVNKKSGKRFSEKIIVD